MYEVSYSGHVIDAIRELIVRNLGWSARFLVALREFDRRARIYPQFGQPLRDLVAPLRLWVGVVHPLVFHYVLDEENRRVMVVRPPQPLPNSHVN